MSSDRARVSYDPTRKWRGLVAQQGRVTVEADWNEAAAIDAAEDRAVTLDVVGPVGTPDSGYAVTATRPVSSPPAATPPGSPEGGLTVGPGTLYLGGERLDLGQAVDLANQPDWLDWPTGTLWVAAGPGPPSPPPATINELVYLLAIEQEVSALEDPALADVALGGPDTMQRLRVLQRFVRWTTHAKSCEQAWTEVQAAWTDVGLTLETTMRLRSTATLQVGFVTDQAPASPCQPVATGGYLGAENQLIRVQIASVDDGVPTIVWGFDDATFLYELDSAQLDGNGHVIFTLTETPVDSYHYPVTGQAVELLRDTASLTPDDPGSATADGYIAAASGQVFTLTQGYDSSSGTAAAAYTGASLPPDYVNANQLYLRVWQGSMTAPAGTPVTLTGASATTGVTVTLSSPTGAFHPGDFWRFALRPSMPNLIYPARYGVPAQPQPGVPAGPQPPDGPRVLACPVALVTWFRDVPPKVTSCIPAFDNLVELSGPTVTPAIHVTETSWTNDGVVPFAQLVEPGITIKLGMDASHRLTSPITARNFIVTFEAVSPWPTDFNVRGVNLHAPIIVDFATITASTTTSGTTTLTTLTWVLPGQNNIPIALQGVIFGLGATKQALVRVRLLGEMIYADAVGGSPPADGAVGRLYLDGRALGQPGFQPNTIDLLLPSGSGAVASDFEGWFFVTPVSD